MKFEIKSRWDGRVLFEADAGSLRACLEIGVKKGADLKGADLKGAYLEGAYLKGAYLQPIRDDFWAVLCSAPAEVPALREALVKGRVDGSTYTGECACLVGTIAKARNCDYSKIPGLTPNANRPAEKFFAGISQGDKPETNHFSKIALDWIDEWSANMELAFKK